MSDHLLTDGFDSSRGPYMPHGLGGGVGANNRFGNSGDSDIYGTLWWHGTTSTTTDGTDAVHQELHSNGALSVGNSMMVSSEAWINGNASTGGTFTIGGPLNVPPGASVSGVTAMSVNHVPVTVPEPCDCGSSAVVPIGNIVSHYATTNDNMAIGLDEHAFETGSGRLDLPCGHYYLTRIGGGAITIVAHGHTALFIGGDISTSSPITITVDPTATLDLFIAGTVTASDMLTIGSPNTPAATRVYIGSTSGFTISSGGTIAANFYVPNGPVVVTGGLTMYGSIFAKNFNADSSVVIHFDRAILRAGDDCPGTPVRPLSDGGTPPPDAGPPAGCNTCLDCGNQACVAGHCGACTTSSQCCAPLTCWMGQCVAVPG
jgi:hypothetical protein